ncbi:Integral membrane protein DUF6 [Verrucomicrobiia bacterium DG1235]|nr:Integral membrane protein DUF6 [Verrucomicrobiae bacterium DG1235]
MICLAFAALYLIWGSTYLAIKVAVETMPPFLMATGRFFLAGLVLYGVARASGAARPSGGQWKHSWIVGGFLIAGGNGVVSYAETFIDSSMAALIIASNPLFMTLFGWWGGVQAKPGRMAWLSLAGGFVGVATLIASGSGIEWGNSLFGYILVVGCVLLWTVGSIYSKRNPQEMNPWLQSGMQMICGGAICLLAGGSMGEFSTLDFAAISSRSWIAFGYLFIVGSLIGFTSYVYLLKHCVPSTVSSHAYVNPVVAVILGWLILGETLNMGGWVGSGMILVSVFILLRQGRK